MSEQKAGRGSTRVQELRPSLIVQNKAADWGYVKSNKLRKHLEREVAKISFTEVKYRKVSNDKCSLCIPSDHYVV